MIAAPKPYLTLCSGGIRTPERLAAYRDACAEAFEGCARVLFVPWALADGDAYLRLLEERGLAPRARLDGIHRAPDPVRAVEEAEAILVGGGNSFRLLAAVQRHGLLEPIRRRVAGGMPYLGVSAGTNLACPTIRTTNDMPIVEPQEGLGALGLVPFQINPHFHAGGVQVADGRGGWSLYAGETREDRLREYLEENPGPVLGLWEGAVLTCRSGEVKLSFERARLLPQAGPTREFAGPCRLDDLCWTETGATTRQHG